MSNSEQRDSEILELKNFDLNQIGATFRIAEFERKISQTTVNKIVNAILERKMHNKILRVYKNKDETYSVLDGQHRLKALEIVHRGYEIHQFDLILEIVPRQDSRDVYININSGRALNSKDFTKAADDGSVEFFKKFRDILGHYKTKKVFSYYDILQAVSYSRTGLTSRVFSNDLKMYIDAITEIEQKYIRKTVEAVYTDNTSISHTPLAKTSIFKNLMRVAFMRPELDTIELYELGNKIIANKKVKNVLVNQGSTRTALLLIWELIIHEILPRPPHIEGE